MARFNPLKSWTLSGHMISTVKLSCPVGGYKFETLVFDTGGLGKRDRLDGGGGER